MQNNTHLIQGWPGIDYKVVVTILIKLAYVSIVSAAPVHHVIMSVKGRGHAQPTKNT